MPNELPNKITSEALDELIAASKVKYTKLGLTTTHCMITLPCGFTISGESACVDPANYDKELGEKYALEKAKDSLWAFEGYLLAWRLHTRAEWLENQTGEPLEPCVSQQKEV